MIRSEHMSKLIFLIIVLATAFAFQTESHAQEAGEIRVTVRRAPTGADGKPLEDKAVELPAVVIPSGADPRDAIMGAVFDRAVGKNDSFQVTVDNRSARDWSFLIVAQSPDESCGSTLPFLAFSDAGFVRDGQVPVGSVGASSIVRSEWLRESNSGNMKFAVLIARSDQPLRRIFMAVEFLAGLATGRAEPRAEDLAELKLGQPKGKSEAGEEYTSGRQRITITLGSVYSESGEALRTTEYYDALLLIAQCRYKYNRGSVPLDALRIGWLNNRGLANYQTGRLAEAKSDYELALTLIEKLKTVDSKPRTFERLITLTNLAQVYATLGDQDGAIARYKEAAALAMRFPPVEIGPSTIAVYGGLGTSLEFKGNHAEALDNYTKAVELARRHHMEASEGILLNSLGRLAANAGRRAEAEKYFNDAIAVSERTGNQAGIGSASNNLGWFYVQDKRYVDAHASFIRSSEIFAGLGNRTAEATALGNLMFVERLQNRPEAAIYFGKRAVRLLQSVRSGLTTVEKQLQRSFLVSREETYRTLADLLISTGRLLEAQSVLELLKDEEHGGAKTRAGNSAEVAPYNDAEDSIQLKIDELANLRKQREELQAERQQLGSAFTKQAELDSVDKSLSMVRAAFARSLERLARVEPSVNDRVNAILGERNLQTILSTLKKDHKTEAVAVYTVIGTEEIPDPTSSGNKKTKTKFGWTILVTASDRKAYPIDVNGLEETVLRFRLASADAKFDPKAEAQKLYSAIFRQVAPKQTRTLEQDLKAALATSPNKTVMWSLDGVMRYVPPAALHDGEKYLVEKFRNVVFTSRSLGQLQTPGNPAWKVLGMGVSDGRPGFGALAGAADELKYIVRPGMFDGEILLNENFRKDDALRVWKDKRFPVIHIASHFKFQPTDPKASYLLVGDGEIRIGDIEYEDNLFDGVDLLALSACDTAMSGNGKESESFAYLAQDLGARTVLASLWPVSDASTPELMARFYKLRSADPAMTKGEAFHRAQLSLVRGEKIEGLAPVPKRPVTDPAGAATSSREDNRGGPLVVGGRPLPKFVPDPNRPFAHPHYWAPFILIGNWS